MPSFFIALCSYNTAISAAMMRAVLKWINVGIQVSFIWLCWLSAFKPAVGPSVVSEAGEPASPSADAAQSSIILCGAEKPSFKHNGINKTAKIGIVPKDEPIPIVIIRPINNIAAAASNLEFWINGNIEFIRFSIPPVSFKTSAYPAQTSITKAM